MVIVKNHLSLIVTSLVAAGICSSRGELIIGSLNGERTGNASIAEGAFFEGLRSSVSTNFSNVEFRVFSSLSEASLTDVDLLILTPGELGIGDEVIPLSEDEQDMVLEHVSDGGGALVLTDNYSFAASAAELEAALLAPFGMSGCCTLVGDVNVTIADSTDHLTTDGPFGAVNSFTQYFPGALTNLGPYAVSLGSNGQGFAGAVIDRDSLNAGSGRVAVFSDASMFIDDEDSGKLSENLTLLLNTIAWSRPLSTSPSLRITLDENEVVLRWSSSATDYSLESSTEVGSEPGWIPVEHEGFVLEGDLMVTNSVVGNSKYYRLTR